MRSKIKSLTSMKVLSPIETTPKRVNPVGCIWVFVRKRDKFKNISRYKAQLVAQGFIQRPSIDYEEAYSHVMDLITFRYLLSLAIDKKLETKLMDVVTAYMYGNLDNNIHMRIPTGLVEFQHFQRQQQCLKFEKKKHCMTLNMPIGCDKSVYEIL